MTQSADSLPACRLAGASCRPRRAGSCTSTDLGLEQLALTAIDLSSNPLPTLSLVHHARPKRKLQAKRTSRHYRLSLTPDSLRWTPVNCYRTRSRPVRPNLPGSILLSSSPGPACPGVIRPPRRLAFGRPDAASIRPGRMPHFSLSSSDPRLTSFLAPRPSRFPSSCFFLCARRPFGSSSNLRSPSTSDSYLLLHSRLIAAHCLRTLCCIRIELQLSSPDQATRQAAEEQLEKVANENFVRQLPATTTLTA